MNKQVVNVAIAGLGTIGSGVAEVILDHEAKGLGIKLVKILEKNTDGTFAQPYYEKFPELFVDDLQTILNDPSIDVIVETIGGLTFAKTLIESALNAGKHVVSANKDLVATNGKALIAIAEKAQKQFLFEASVCGAIPVIRLLQNYLTLQDIQAILGIVNGTANYILSEMDDQGMAFETALKGAQDLGFSEPDPTNDIKGYDARYKITILTYLITGKWLSVDDITVEGIDSLDSLDFDYAARMHRKIKLVAYSAFEKGQLKVFVLPLMLPEEHPLSKITGSTNIITLQGKYSDDISLIGKGAGSLPTASAVVSDLYKIRDGGRTEAPLQPKENYKLVPFSEYVFKHTLRFDANDQPGIVGKIGIIFEKYGISIYALEQLPQYHFHEENAERVIFTLTLDACKEGTIRQAIEKINAEPFMLKPVVVLRELCE